MKPSHFLPLALVLVGCSSTGPHLTALTADQARTLARQLANEQARALYGAQPFWDGGPARLVQGRWVWSDRRGSGLGDLQATVSLTADGAPHAVEVMLLDSRIIY